MRIIYLGDNSKISYQCLNYLRSIGVAIVAVSGVSHIYNPILNQSDIPESDWIISVLYHNLVKKPLLTSPKYGAINFHPAPLPKYRGFAPYTFGVYNQSPTWGVSAHFMDSHFDTGDIIKVITFDIDPDVETAFSLMHKSHNLILLLFKSIMNKITNNIPLPRYPQTGRYHTNTKSDFENLRVIQPTDNPEIVSRKMRAFWCPPHKGAYRIKEENYNG